ncbi:MAG: hypothetical protein AAGF88_09195 [Pseudomonadota bacterium]
MLIRLLLVACLAIPTWGIAQTRDTTELTRLDTDNPEAFAFFDAIGLYDVLAILAEESIVGADLIRDEFFPNLSPDIWRMELETLFAPTVLVAQFEAGWDDDAVGPEARAILMEVFTSDLGRRIVEAELIARQAMTDPEIAEAAQGAYALALADGDPRLPALSEFLDENGFLARNVTSAMNGQVSFLTGLSDAGGLRPPMAEVDILRFVAAQEDAIRSDAEAWLRAFHLMAYGSFTAEEFETFRAYNQTPEFQAMTASVFAAFDPMFEELQYQLGQITARYSAGDDI